MSDWKKIKEETVYQGWRNMIRRWFRMPDGSEVDFDIFDSNDYVTIAALTEDGAFLLIRQFRPGPEKVLHSFPEGAIDKGESPEVAARRELLEETGYEAKEIVFLRKIYDSYKTGTQFCLLATGCRKIQAQQLDKNEYLEVYTLSVPELRKLLRNSDDEEFHNIGCGYMALEKLGQLAKSNEQ